MQEQDELSKQDMTTTEQRHESSKEPAVAVSDSNDSSSAGSGSGVMAAVQNTMQKLGLSS